MASEERKLTLKVNVDEDAVKPLKRIGDQADNTKDDLKDLDDTLKKVDGTTEKVTKDAGRTEAGLKRLAGAAGAAGAAADGAADDLDDMNLGLRKLDDRVEKTTRTIAELRKEIARTGDLDLIKDVQKQEQRLKALTRQRKSLLGEMFKPEDVTEIGVSVGARIGPIMIQSLSQAVAKAGPAIAIGAPIVAGLATYLGGAAAGGILAVAAGGAVAGGVALAAKDPRVQSEASKLAASIGSQLEDAAKPFVPATIGAIRIVRAGFDDLDDDLRGIFAGAAGYLEPLTRGLVGFVRELAPGFRKAVTAAEPIIRMIEGQLPELGREVGELFATMADHAEEGAVAIGYLFETIGAGIKLVAGTVSVLSSIFKWADITAATMRGDWAHLDNYIDKGSQAEGATTSWADALKGLSKESKTATKEVESLHAVIKRITDDAVNSENALIAYEAAIDDAAAAAKDGAKGISRHTEAGRENREALIAIRDAAFEVADQVRKTTGSEVKATEATERGRAAFLRAADAMGVSAGQAKRLADRLFGIPSPKPKVEVNTTQARRNVDVLRGKIAQIDRNVHIRATFDLINNKDVAMALRLGRLSEGGPVTGPGPKGVDSKPYLLAPGEYVLPADEVDALGGTAAIDAWRKNIMAGGKSAAVAAGARSGGGATAVALSLEGSGPMYEVVRLLWPYMRARVRNQYGGSAERAFA